MCGIAGIVAYRDSAPNIDEAELHALREAMAVRGPDGKGSWVSSNRRAALAHRRLAIIDLSQSGAQPMAATDHGLHITFNGEIYNYQELRSDLLAKGYRFRSTSDTEVLLHLYAERGAKMVASLRGMFAFAIWDEPRRTLFLARDPFGIKPLYYADSGSTLRFASQVKALAAGGQIDLSPEPAGHVGFFVLGSVPEPYTMYRSIRALPAGSTLTLKLNDAPRVSTFFDVGQELAAGAGLAKEMSKDEMRLRLRDALRDSVTQHMVADVPVGLFLSSGLDSSTIAALACEIKGADLRSVTLGFEEYRGTANDETRQAQATASHLGTIHDTKWITRDTFESEFDKVISAMDQPSIDGVNTYFVSKSAAESGMKVALSGLGGDELFGGYPSFRDIPRLVRTFRALGAVPHVGTVIRKFTAPLLGTFTSPKFASLVEHGGTFPGAYLLRRALYMPWEVRDFMDPALFESGWRELHLIEALRNTIEGVSSERASIAALELSWYMRNQLLRDADWAGMAHSVEIRVPLVDVKLFRTVAPMMALRNAPSKMDLASTPMRPLPSDLLHRRKTGFSIPVHEWAKKKRVAKGPQRLFRNWAQIVYRLGIGRSSTRGEDIPPV